MEICRQDIIRLIVVILWMASGIHLMIKMSLWYRKKSVVTSNAYILFYQRSTLSFISPIKHCVYRGPIHLKLIIKWDLDLRQKLLVTGWIFCYEPLSNLCNLRKAFQVKSFEIVIILQNHYSNQILPNFDFNIMSILRLDILLHFNKDWSPREEWLK